MSDNEHPNASTDALHRHAMQCRNCGHELSGPFCPSCGQPVKTFMRAVWGLVYEMLDEFFSFDSRAVNTFPPLLLRPGFLTNEYIAGRRASYVSPLRLYLLVSIVFFLAFAFLAVDEERFQDVNVDFVEEDDTIQTVNVLEKALAQLERNQKNQDEESREGTQATIDALRKELETARQTSVESKAEQEGAATGKPGVWSAFSWDKEQLEQYGRTQGQRVANNPERFIDKLFGALPQMMFLLLPVFALLLKLFYVFRKRFYTEHLIVALHSHSFLFLAFLLLLLVSVSSEALASAWSARADAILTVAKWMAIIIGIWIPVYLYLMQKRVYRQGWFLTFLKFGLVGIIYLTLLTFAIAGAALIGFATT